MNKETAKGALHTQESLVSQQGLETEVLRRYGNGAEQAEAKLCCPVDYDRKYLEIIPDEILEKDYGCGDPSKYVAEGETVLDLGSGGGKICYILSQKVGPSGQVIGVDFNDRMLRLARKYQDEIAGKLGYSNVSFRKGKIQDLALNLDLVEEYLGKHPVTSVDDAMELEQFCHELRETKPLVSTASVDAVVSNCVLNLVQPSDKRQLFREIARVLKDGGRAVISDIVCDEDPTPSILADPELWSGCISGAFQEAEFLRMFEQSGFSGIRILDRPETPWQIIDGIVFRSLTVEAFRFNPREQLEKRQAAIYRGPWKKVEDEHGQIFLRGESMAVDAAQYEVLNNPSGPYADDVICVEPDEAETSPGLFAAPRRNSVRLPAEMKNPEAGDLAPGEQGCCGPSGCC